MEMGERERERARGREREREKERERERESERERERKRYEIHLRLRLLHCQVMDWKVVKDAFRRQIRYIIWIANLILVKFCTTIPCASLG